MGRARHIPTRTCAPYSSPTWVQGCPTSHVRGLPQRGIGRARFGGISPVVHSRSSRPARNRGSKVMPCAPARSRGGSRMTAEPQPDAAAPVRLILVDDHEMVIEGLKAMLAAFSDRVRVVGQAVGAERAAAVVDELQPDIVLCDVRMQGASGLDCAASCGNAIRAAKWSCCRCTTTSSTCTRHCGSGRRATCSRASAATTWSVSSSWCTAGPPRSTRAWPPGPPTPPPACSATNSGPAPGRASPARERNPVVRGRRPVQPRHRDPAGHR